MTEKPHYRSFADVPKDVETESRWQDYGFKLKKGEKCVALLSIDRKYYKRKRGEQYRLHHRDQVEAIDTEKAQMRRERFETFYYAEWSDDPESEIYQEVHRIATDIISDAERRCRWGWHQEMLNELHDEEAAMRRLAIAVAIKNGAEPQLIEPDWIGEDDMRRIIRNNALTKMRRRLLSFLASYHVQFAAGRDVHEFVQSLMLSFFDDE
jgi:hypothetical protein